MIEDATEKFQSNLWKQSLIDLRRLIVPLLIVGFGISLVQLAQYLKLFSVLGDWRDFFFEGAQWAIWIAAGYMVQRNVLANDPSKIDVPQARLVTGMRYFCVVGLVVLVSSVPAQLIYSILFQASMHSAAHLAMAGMGSGGMIFGVQVLTGVIFLLGFAFTGGFVGAFLPELVLEGKAPMRRILRRSCASWGYVAPRVVGGVVVGFVLKIFVTGVCIWALQPTPIYKPFGLDISWQGFLIANVQLLTKTYLVVLLINVCTRAYLFDDRHAGKSVTVEKIGPKLPIA